MNPRVLQTVLAAVLFIATSELMCAESLRGEVSLSPPPHDPFGADTGDLFGSSLDPEEALERELYVPGDYDSGPAR